MKELITAGAGCFGMIALVVIVIAIYLGACWGIGYAILWALHVFIPSVPVTWTHAAAVAILLAIVGGILKPNVVVKKKSK